MIGTALDAVGTNYVSWSRWWCRFGREMGAGLMEAALGQIFVRSGGDERDHKLDSLWLFHARIMTSSRSRPSPIEPESKLILGQMIDCCLRGNGLFLWGGCLDYLRGYFYRRNYDASNTAKILLSTQKLTTQNANLSFLQISY